MNNQILLTNIQRIHTTRLGEERIKRNLKLETDNVVEYCKSIILAKNCQIIRQGKNWYCKTPNEIVTINSSSYTIITAHLKN